MFKGRAFYAGVIGGIIMSLLMALVRMMGMPVNIGMTLGTMFGLAPGVGTWLLGFIIHLVLSGLIGLLYGVGFEYISHRAGVWIGFGFALIHTVIAGFFFGLLPAIHPMMPEVINSPGIFLSNLGSAGVVGFFILHLTFGGVVGAIYKPVRHTHVAHTGAV